MAEKHRHRKGKMIGFDEQTYVGTWRCKDCGEPFSSQGTICTIEEAEPQNICDTCGTAYTVNADYDKHECWVADKGE